MLHIKSKVMESKIQWCKNFAPGACLWVTSGQKVGFWVLFLLSHNSSLAFWARILILLHALLMRTGGTHLEFWFAWRYAMALARRYVMAHYQLALVFHAKCTQQLLKWYSYLLLNHWIVLMSTDLFLSHYPEISGLLLMGSSYIPFICTYLGGRSYRHQNL